MAKPALVTIPNVPIVEVGYEWPALSGPVTFTREMLIDAVAAANDDPGIPNPRLKLARADDTHGEPITEPAFGRVANLRFDEDEQTVYGDYEGVPEWLADVMPAAYPNRSIEGAFGVSTTTGGSWQLVLTAVQLLGVEWPGCMTLADLPLYYTKEVPKDVKIKLGGAMATTKASVNVDDVRRGYYDVLDEENKWGWWIKGVLLDPNQLVVEDEMEGELYLVDFSINGDEITFGDPVAVQVEYVPKPETPAAKTAAAAYLAAGVMSGRKVLASYATPEESGRVVEVKGGTSMNEEQRKALAKSLGLGDDATEQAISAKLLENAITAQAPEGEEGNGETPDESGTQQPTSPDNGEQQTPGTETATPPAQQPTTTQQPQPAGAVMSVDAGTLQKLQQDAALGRAAHARQAQQDRDALLSTAVREGKFPPARLAHWQAQYDLDPEGTKAHIEGMAPNLIPVEERGITNGGDTAELGMGGDAYPAGWFPEIGRRKAALKAAEERGSRVISEVM